MRAKLLQFLTTMLAIQCVLWVAVAPVLPQLHQALAGHRHVFCFEHYRVEDQAAVEAHGTRPIEPASTDGLPKIVDLASRMAPGRNGVECLSSNFSGYAVFRGSGRVAKRVSSLAPAVRPWREIHVQIADTLRIAPKNSPPLG